MMTDFTAVLQILARHSVEVIVVGGISAILSGAPVLTLDLDLVHARSPENTERLLLALDDLQAEYRYTGGRKLKPNESHLVTQGDQLLTTRFGPVDILGAIGPNLTYDDLLPHTSSMLIADNVTVRVLNLDKLIEIKESLNTEKDRATLPTLKRTLIEIQRRKDGRC